MESQVGTTPIEEADSLTPLALRHEAIQVAAGRSAVVSLAWVGQEVSASFWTRLAGQFARGSGPMATPASVDARPRRTP